MTCPSLLPSLASQTHAASHTPSSNAMDNSGGIGQEEPPSVGPFGGTAFGGAGFYPPPDAGLAQSGGAVQHLRAQLASNTKVRKLARP